jgi:hypothetical protein
MKLIDFLLTKKATGWTFLEKGHDFVSKERPFTNIFVHRRSLNALSASPFIRIEREYMLSDKGIHWHQYWHSSSL